MSARKKTEERARAEVAQMLSLVEDPVMVREARLAELERVVADLCERAGIAFNPPRGRR